MSVQGISGGAFWRDMLIAGGSTTIPDWALEPVAGIFEHSQVIPASVVAALRSRAEEVGVPLRAVLLAAHAKVLSSLCGERDVVTGYLPEGSDRALPCRLETESGTWRALLMTTHREGYSRCSVEM